MNSRPLLAAALAFALGCDGNVNDDGVSLGVTIIVSRPSGSGQANGTSNVRPSVSGDGRFVAFASDASNLVPGDANGFRDVFLRDTLLNTTVRISVEHPTDPDATADGSNANGPSDNPAISADGRFVAFDSAAPDLVPADGNGLADVFVWDRLTGTTVRISVDTLGGDPDGVSLLPSISGDGRFIAFQSSAANLDAAGEALFLSDIFLAEWDPGTGAVTAIQRASAGSAGGESDGDSFFPSVSADGRFVAFASDATDLTSVAESDFIFDIFLWDRTGVLPTAKISVPLAGPSATFDSDFSAVSSGGRFVAFASAASNLVAGDANGVSDIFLRDTQLNTTVLVSANSLGIQGTLPSSLPSISADGRFVAFESFAINLVEGDTNSASDIFVRDVVAGATDRASVRTYGGPSALLANSTRASISAGGRHVAFTSTAENLVDDDANGIADIFLRSR